MKINRFFKKMGVKMSKHSPEILLALGIAGTVGSTVLACRATLKAKEILEVKKEEVDIINKVYDTTDRKEYTDEDKKKDLTIVYTKTCLKIVKSYIPAAIIGGISIGALLKGHNILNKRNATLIAAYATLDTSYKEYRKRVVEKYGENVDNELLLNGKTSTIKAKVKDGEGNEVDVDTPAIEVDGNPLETISPYARFFDEVNSEYYKKDAEFNLMFLRQQQNYANDRLKANGFVFLNEVYSMLGMNQTKIGQLVGWVYNENSEESDNYIDFGIYNIKNKASRAFVNGNERAILLDFNVDGVILDRI